MSHVWSALLLCIKYLPHHLKCFRGAAQGSAAQKWQEYALPDVSHRWTPALVPLFTFQAQDTLFPATELPADALMEREMRHPPDKGGVVWFCFKVWGIIFSPGSDLWWHGTTIFVPGWNPGISEIKEMFPLTSVEPGFLPCTCFSATFFQVRKHENTGNDVKLCIQVVNFPTKIEKSDWTELTDLQICLHSLVASPGFHCTFLLGKFYTFCGYLEILVLDLF